MKYKVTPSRRFFMVFAYAFMILIAIICIAPLWHVLMASISNPTMATNSKGLILWPLGHLDFKAYEIILGYGKLWKSYGNTILYIIGQCIVTGIGTVIAGYVFSRKRFFYRNTFMMIISFTMLFNGGMIPTYLVVKELGLLNTIWALILPGAVPVFSVIMVMNFFKGIPKALEEAAIIDGASPLQVLTKVYIPCSKPVIATTALFSIVGSWNDFMGGLIYMTKIENYPLQTYIQTLSIKLEDMLNSGGSISSLINAMEVSAQNLNAAKIVVSVIPLLLIYPLLQKYLITGIVVGSVKE